MLKRKLALLAIVFCAPALQAEPLVFNCNAPVGHISEVRQSQLAQGFQLRGRIEPRGLAELPVATTAVGGRNIMGPSRNGRVEVMSVAASDYVTLAISADPEGRTLHAVLLYAIADRAAEIPVSSHDGPVPGGRLSIPFEFLFEPNRTRVQVGGRSFDLPLALTGEIEASASCEGGSFNFRDLELTHSPAGESGQP